jgi:hypothetical protein
LRESIRNFKVSSQTIRTAGNAGKKTLKEFIQGHKTEPVEEFAKAGLNNKMAGKPRECIKRMPKLRQPSRVACKRLLNSQKPK